MMNRSLSRAPQRSHAILEDVDTINSSSKLCCINLTPYDGAFEKACVQFPKHNGPRPDSSGGVVGLWKACFVVAEDFKVVKFSERIVAQYLLEDLEPAQPLTPILKAKPAVLARTGRMGTTSSAPRRFFLSRAMLVHHPSVSPSSTFLCHRPGR